ncbi:Methylase involved in ubiquinone/menaquinone biosynthesis [Desulfovibrionales bacterium]
MWDAVAISAYQYWLQTRHGIFAFNHKKMLLEHLISPWPRRNQRLLEIGCGLGMFLELFWKCGFDVTGLDTSVAMLEATRSRLSNRVELRLGCAERLPFQDNEYDFVALITVLEFVNNPDVILSEAVRVARKGLLLCFLNKYSWHYLASGLPTPWNHSTLFCNAHWFGPLEVRRLLSRILGRRPIYSRSIIPGPPWTWWEIPSLRFCNSFLLPPFLGAYVGVRIHLLEDKPLTPLCAFTTEPRMLH